MMRLPALFSATCVAVLGIATFAEDKKPERRAHHALVFHDELGRVLLVGGSSPIGDGEQAKFLDDVWSFDGKKWELVAATGDRRCDVRLAYDPRGKHVVSFGGYTGETLADLRVWEGTKWRVIDESSAVALAVAGFVYDSARNRFVLFGGVLGDQVKGETWEHDAQAWTKFEGATPPARRSHAMVFDAKRACTVVFGGISAAAPGSRST